MLVTLWWELLIELLFMRNFVDRNNTKGSLPSFAPCYYGTTPCLGAVINWSTVISFLQSRLAGNVRLSGYAIHSLRVLAKDSVRIFIITLWPFKYVTSSYRSNVMLWISNVKLKRNYFIRIYLLHMCSCQMFIFICKNSLLFLIDITELLFTLLGQFCEGILARRIHRPSQRISKWVHS